MHFRWIVSQEPSSTRACALAALDDQLLCRAVAICCCFSWLLFFDFQFVWMEVENVEQRECILLVAQIFLDWYAMVAPQGEDLSNTIGTLTYSAVPIIHECMREPSTTPVECGANLIVYWPLSINTRRGSARSSGQEQFASITANECSAERCAQLYSFKYMPICAIEPGH